MNTNPENYKWGIFYFNRSDQRVIVPKVNKRMGWTFNFARPESYIILAVFIFIMIIITGALNNNNL
jgi:uncharacterized membrane protein